MVSARIRLRLNGIAEDPSGTEYTQYLYKATVELQLNSPGRAEITLLGSTNTSDIAVGNIFEVYYGTTMTAANRFFKGIITKIEEKTAKNIKFVGSESGWITLSSRQHTQRKEWGTASSEATARTRADIINYLISEDLTGTGDDLIASGTIVSSGTDVPFFSTEYEKRHSPFFRAAQQWGTDVYMTQNGSGVDQINITTKGTDVSGTRIFNLKGTSKNAKVGSNVLDYEGQSTLVTVLGAGSGVAQAVGKSNSGAYSPISPEKDLVVIRPELRTDAECVLVAQQIWSEVSAVVQRVRIQATNPNTWLVGATAIVTGDIIAIATSDLVNLVAGDYRVFEKTFTLDNESGEYSLTFQLAARATSSGDQISSTNQRVTEATSSTQYQTNGLSLWNDLPSSGGGHFICGSIWVYGDQVNAFQSFPLYIYSYDGGHSDIVISGHSAAPGTLAGGTTGNLYWNNVTQRLNYFDQTAAVWRALANTTEIGSSLWESAGGDDIQPVTAGNDLLKKTSGDIGASATPWDNGYITTITASTYNGGNADMSEVDIRDLLWVKTGATASFDGRIDTNFLPETTDTYDCGNSTYMWRDIYSLRHQRFGDSGVPTQVTWGSQWISSFSPYTTNTYNNGAAARRWATVYGIDSDFTGSKSFCIDHPLDPLNKRLIHSSVESPGLYLLYKGRGELKNGKCKITMPNWFHSLNGAKEEMEYYISPIGKYSNLYVSKVIDDDFNFEVKGDIDCEFSWMVCTLRQDPSANLRRRSIEEDKDETDKGLYLDPDAYESIDPGCKKRQEEEARLRPDHINEKRPIKRWKKVGRKIIIEQEVDESILIKEKEHLLKEKEKIDSRLAEIEGLLVQE
uniref:Tail protein n=1 Tax=viral metagenome TaxID=1070528 RepID=A0A6M3IKK1_9ZZZZ